MALDAIADPDWFRVFQDAELWSSEDASRLIPAWIARDLSEWDRVPLAAEWQRRLGRSFTEQLERRVLQVEGLQPTEIRAWRLLGQMASPPDSADCYVLRKHFETGVVLDGDLRRAVELLAPTLVFERNYRAARMGGSGSPERLRDVVWPRMVAGPTAEVEDLVAILCEQPSLATRTMELATAQLHCTLRLQCDLELIGDDYDCNDFEVPSIERHAQNAHHDGVCGLVRALVDLLPHARALDKESTRALARGWLDWPGRLGLRLCFHAMRDAQLFEADEAVERLLATTDVEFWAIRRETALLLRERASDASRELVRRAEERIVDGGGTYFSRYEIEPGEPDWRPWARDSAVWLRLKMLDEAGTLSEAGAAELSAIRERNEELDRAVEDQDFFGAYSWGVRAMVGDAEPIRAAPDSDRVRVAEEVFQSSDPEVREGWAAYCRSNPRGAFAALSSEGWDARNAMWKVLLRALAFGDEGSRSVREEVAVNVLEYLVAAGSEVLGPMASTLVDVLWLLRGRVRELAEWADRLWLLVAEEAELVDWRTDIFAKAINTASGKLTELRLLEMESSKGVGEVPTPEQLAAIGRVAGHDGGAGRLGRAVLARNVGFLEAVTARWVGDVLAPKMNADDAEGAALRAVMVRYGAVTPGVTRVVGGAVVRGVVESGVDGLAARVVAAAVLRPTLAEIGRGGSPRWGLTASDGRRALREASHSIRRGALEVLLVWLREGEGGAEVTWRCDIAPLIAGVWPRERRCRDVSLTQQWVELTVGAGGEFPSALRQLRPYIVAFGEWGSLHAVAESEVAERFPRETVDLLWLVCGPGNGGGSYGGMAELIDRVVSAESNLEVDRRVQWIEQRTMRL